MRTFPKLLSVAISSKNPKDKTDKDKAKPVLVPLKDGADDVSVRSPTSPTKLGIFKSNSWNTLGVSSENAPRRSTTTLRRLRSQSDGMSFRVGNGHLLNELDIDIPNVAQQLQRSI